MSEPAAQLLLRDAEVDGVVGDVLLGDGVIVELGASRARAGTVIDCAGAAVIPGLHDHHCHLLAMAAALDSVHCGPPAVRDAAGMQRALAAGSTRGGWLRGIGYDESVAGVLDRHVLDRLAPNTPTRVQHRSGALWVLNSAAIDALDLAGVGVEGIGRDAAGHPTGELWRLDGWLRDRLGDDWVPDLAAVSRTLAGYGITGVTDATPELDGDAVRRLTGGAVQQRLCLLGASGAVEGASLGPFKIVVADHALPSWDALAAQIRAVRPRPVALHSVTRVSLVLILAVLGEVGSVRGDRIEHAAVAPPELVGQLRELGLTVVTQPSLVAARGADYLDRTDAEDLEHLWPWRRLDEAGVPVGCSSDAPYGDADPWASIASAVNRRAADGRTVNGGERVSATRALSAYLTRPLDPGGRPRQIVPGEPADLAVLDRPLRRVIDDPASVRVRATLIGGRVAAQ
ncbi:amidohydrolase family protein [Jatrophihabitans sp.]|uniref:amidohydrolase family protein n=1 Tax=Jatrophihabitans sp. TaxID=1932789 RepID=UPI0030C6A71C